MALIIRITTTPTNPAAPTSRICTTKQNVRPQLRGDVPMLIDTTAKKEDSPDGALKDFRAIVEQEEEKGDWYVNIAS